MRLRSLLVVTLPIAVLSSLAVAQDEPQLQQTLAKIVFARV
jgi:hypothetical protein